MHGVMLPFEKLKAQMLNRKKLMVQNRNSLFYMFSIERLTHYPKVAYVQQFGFTVCSRQTALKL
jgi:hypothetical protein